MKFINKIFLFIILSAFFGCSTNKNPLETYFHNNEKRLIHKWNHYFEIYHRHLAKFRGKDITIVEIGVSHGGSLQMWKDYFGPKAKIIGVDIDPRTKQVEEKQIKVFIGDQEDVKFLSEFKKSVPRIDILIDDGGHTMNQQITTFEELFPHITKDGVYLCEDTHTSYRNRYKGGYLRDGTFMEMSKGLVDYLNAWHSKDRNLKPNKFTESVNSIHFYDSVVVIEKKPMKIPFHLKSGKIKLK